MITKPDWLGYFYGGRLGFHQYEVLTIQHIPLKLREKDLELLRTKWFDYRRLHPMQATYFFIKCYNDAYRDLYRKAIDADAAPYVRSIRTHDFLESREKLSFWRLRQLCDLMGVPYEFFLARAMDWHVRVCLGERVYPPRPSQILHNEEMIATIALAWEEQQNVSTQIACDPWYRTSQFVHSEDQIAHEQFVIGQIERRIHAKYALKNALYHDDVLRFDIAVRHFGGRQMDIAAEC